MTEAFNARVAACVARHAAAVAEVAAARAAVTAATTAATAAQTARTAGQRVALGVQQKAHKDIAGIVSMCLATVFDEPYGLTIDFVRRRGRTEAVLGFLKRGHRVDPLTAAGGGAVGVAALALRLASLVLARPPGRLLLVTDEPLANLHAPRYRKRARALVEALAAQMGVQFVVVTGEPEFEIGKVVRLC